MEKQSTISDKHLMVNKNFHILNVVSFVSIMSNVLNPAFRVIAEAFQITPDQVGLLTTVYSLPMVFLSPVVGIITDRIGKKKVLSLSLLIFGLSAIPSMLSNSYHWLLFGEFIRGFGQPGMVIVTIVLIGDLFEDKLRNQVMGMNTAVMNLGLALLPIIGGILAGWGWYYPYLVFFAAVPVAFIVMFWMDEPKLEKGTEKILPYVKEALTYYWNKRVMVLSILSFFVYALLAGCFLVYIPFLLEDPSWTGVVFAVMSIASCGPAVILGKLIDWIGEERLLLLTFVCFAAAFLVGAQAESVSGILVCSAIFGIGIGIIMPVQMIMLLPLSPDHVRGAFISVQNLIHRLGQALGPVIFGAIYIQTQMSGVFYGAALMSGIAFVIALAFLREKSNKANAS